MNKKSLTKVFGGTAVLGAVLLLTSCNSFCSNLDTSNYMFGYNGMNTTYFESYEQGEQYILDTFKAQSNVDVEKVNLDCLVLEKNANDTNDDLPYVGEDGQNNHELFFYKVNDNLFALKNVTIYAKGISTVENTNGVSYTFGLNDFTKTLITNAASYNMITPSPSYWEELDRKVLNAMIEEAKTSSLENLTNLSLETLTYEQVYGYTSAQLSEYKNDTTNEELLNEMLEGGENNIGRNNALLARTGFVKYYNEENPTDKFLNIKNWNNEIVTSEGFSFDDGLSTNFLNLMATTLNTQTANLRTCITVNEGLLVYPIGTMVENFAHIFGMNGYGQIFAVLLATLIIRVLFMLVTMPSTLSQQKMTLLQPEIAKLQQKYPNANSNDYEKQKLAAAQMALYKKYKVHPFASLLIIFVQFPVFICVWNALQGSASLSRDAVLGLRLSDTIWSVLSNFSGWPSNPGWWTALVLVILMSAAQIVSMLIPNWLNKKKMKSVTKLNNSSSMNQQNKTLKYTQWIMTIFIIFMGFTLPSAMGVYWFAGAIISIIQSVIIHYIFIARSNKRNGKYKDNNKEGFNDKVKRLFTKKKEGSVQ